jgi:hypothetical protein
VKDGGRGEGKCERERALEQLRCYSPGHFGSRKLLGWMGKNRVKTDCVFFSDVSDRIFFQSSTIQKNPVPCQNWINGQRIKRTG